MGRARRSYGERQFTERGLSQGEMDHRMISESELLRCHERAHDATGRVIGAIGDDQWQVWVGTSNTDVRTLVNHIVTSNLEVPWLVAGESIEQVRARTAGDHLADGVMAAYEASGEVAQAVFSAEGALEVDCQDTFGRPKSGFEYCGARFVDTLVHGWEIAKVTSQDTVLDVDLVEAAISVIEPEILRLRAEGIIKDALEVPADADPQERFLALFGYQD